MPIQHHQNRPQLCKTRLCIPLNPKPFGRAMGIDPAMNASRFMDSYKSGIGVWPPLDITCIDAPSIVSLSYTYP